MSSKVVIMRGVSGSGKSTYIKKFFPNAFICSADYFHMDKDGTYNWKPENTGKAHAACMGAFLHALKNEVPLVVVDNTNTRVWEFNKYIAIARSYDAEVHVIRLDVPLKGLYGRNVHGVPDENVKIMYDRMEPYDGEEVVKQSS